MEDKTSVLLVDDDSEALESLSRALSVSNIGARIVAATRAEKGLELLAESKADVAVIDLSLDPARGVESGFELLSNILRQDAACRVIVLTGHGSLEHGVRALSLGAASFLEKPADISHLAALIRDGIRQSGLKRAYNSLILQQQSSVATLVAGSSHAMQKVRESIQYAAQTMQPVMIYGETGTGKGLCAQAIHALSPRKSQRFVRYQPNFSTADLVNSDLFGYVKGAFTGASDNRKGLLTEAHLGTLFLDEIEALPSETQVTLLGVLQDKRFRMVGSDRENVADFRLICASNENVELCVEQGRIRRDFYHRVAHFKLELPALRDRRVDIAELSELFLGRLREREQLSVFSIEASAHEMLLAYDWPGNVRELESVLEGAAYHARFKGRAAISSEDIHTGSTASASGEAADFASRVLEYKRKLINESLARHGGNQSKASRELGLDRSTMLRILKR